MHIRHIVFASISLITAGFAYCASLLAAPAEYLRVHWPEFVPLSPHDSIELDVVLLESQASPSPMARFVAFCQRALLHARYSAGGFGHGQYLAAS